MIEFSRLTPPSSSGPGRGPLKAKTRIRIPLGAQQGSKTRIPTRGMIFEFLRPAGAPRVGAQLFLVSRVKHQVPGLQIGSRGTYPDPPVDLLRNSLRMLTEPLRAGVH